MNTFEDGRVFVKSPGSMGACTKLGLFATFVVLATIPRAGIGDEQEKDDGSFSVSQPVLCKDVRGYEDYEELSVPELTSEDKLLVYFRPRHFKAAVVGNKFEAHFTQDGKIRRRGEKPVLWQKVNLLDYSQKGDSRDLPVSIRNTVSLKTLKPGEYEYEIILRDEVGKSAPASRKVYFKVVAAKAKEEPSSKETPVPR